MARLKKESNSPPTTENGNGDAPRPLDLPFEEHEQSASWPLLINDWQPYDPSQWPKAQSRRCYTKGKSEKRKSYFENDRNMNELLMEFMKHRDENLVTEFSEFLKRKNMLAVIEEDIPKVRKMYYSQETFCSRLEIYERFLKKEEFADLLDETATYCGTDGEYEPSLNFRYVIAMMKHSRKSLADISREFISKTYSSVDPWSNSFGLVLETTSKQNLFFFHLISRITTYNFRILPPDYVCVYCYWVGIHFSDECPKYHSQELKNQHLDGACKKCILGRSCLASHIDGLHCGFCEDDSHEYDMCTDVHKVIRNKKHVEDMRLICMALRGWTAKSTLAMLKTVMEWSLQNEDDFTKKWILMSEYRIYVNNFSNEKSFFEEGYQPLPVD